MRVNGVTAWWRERDEKTGNLSLLGGLLKNWSKAWHKYALGDHCPTASSKESGHVLRHLSLCSSETHLHLLDG